MPFRTYSFFSPGFSSLCLVPLKRLSLSFLLLRVCLVPLLLCPYLSSCLCVCLMPLVALSLSFLLLRVCLVPLLLCPYLSSCFCVCLVPLVALSLSFLLLVCLPGAPGIPVLIFPPACESACMLLWNPCPYLSSCLWVCLHVTLESLSLSFLLCVCLVPLEALARDPPLQSVSHSNQNWLPFAPRILDTNIFPSISPVFPFAFLSNFVFLLCVLFPWLFCYY